MTLGELYQLARMLRDITSTAGSLTHMSVHPSEAMVFEDIVQHPNTTINQVAERTHLAQSRVSTMVNAMVTEGAVTVSTNSQDQRRKTLQASPQLLQDIKAIDSDEAIRQAIHRLYPSLSEHQIVNVTQHLDHIFTLLSADSRSES